MGYQLPPLRRHEVLEKVLWLHVPYRVDEFVRCSQFRPWSGPVSPAPDHTFSLQLLPQYFRGENGKIYRQYLVLSGEYLSRDVVSTTR